MGSFRTASNVSNRIHAPPADRAERGGARVPSTSSCGGAKSGAFELTLEGGRLGPVTPYVDGAITSSWYSGRDAPRRTLAGLEGIRGTAVRLTPRGPLALKAEVRPGYVHTQEHDLTVHVGVIYVR